MGRYAKSFHGRHTSTDYQDRIKAISEEARERFGLNERRMRGTIEVSGSETETEAVWLYRSRRWWEHQVTVRLIQQKVRQIRR